jgi:RNA polymerase sigma-70 factor (ECF subfamily)
MDDGCTTTGFPWRDRFEAVVRENQAGLFRFAFRLTRHEQDAEDLVQETLLRGYRRFGELNDSGSVRPWLLRIATNAFIGIYRRRRRREEGLWSPEEVVRAFDSRAGFDLLEAPEPIRVHGEVMAAVERLPVAYREAIAAVDLGEATYEEAAEILACPIGTVMSRLNRGRTLLRSSLGSYARVLGLAA